MRSAPDRQIIMTIPQYGRAVTTSAILLLITLFAVSQAHADAYWAKDVSVSSLLARPTAKDADIAHVALVVSNTSSQGDALLSAEVSPRIAAYVGFDALPTSVYRGASLRRSQPVFLSAGQTKTLGLDGVHLVLYGIRGPLTNGMGIPVRLTFEKAGSVDVIVEVSNASMDIASAGVQSAMFVNIEDQAAPAADGPQGAAFGCQDGSKLFLDFEDEIDGLSAVVSVAGSSHRLPVLAPEPGPVQIMWSDGVHTLTWRPGVKLMWMGEGAHLMCGRSGHQH